MTQHRLVAFTFAYTINMFNNNVKFNVYILEYIVAISSSDWPIWSVLHIVARAEHGFYY
jgi:hypothetical protein